MRRRSITLKCGCRFIEDDRNSDGVCCRKECPTLLAMYARHNAEFAAAKQTGRKRLDIPQDVLAHWWNAAREAAIALGKQDATCESLAIPVTHLV